MEDIRKICLRFEESENHSTYIDEKEDLFYFVKVENVYEFVKNIIKDHHTPGKSGAKIKFIHIEKPLISEKNGIPHIFTWHGLHSRYVANEIQGTIYMNAIMYSTWLKTCEYEQSGEMHASCGPAECSCSPISDKLEFCGFQVASEFEDLFSIDMEEEEKNFNLLQ
jgi:hypothetical protein